MVTLVPLTAEILSGRLRVFKKKKRNLCSLPQAKRGIKLFGLHKNMWKKTTTPHQCEYQTISSVEHGGDVNAFGGDRVGAQMMRLWVELNIEQLRNKSC